MYPFLTVFFISINRSYNNITLTVQFINFWEISFHQKFSFVPQSPQGPFLYTKRETANATF